MAVGAIIDGEQANNIIANNRADLVAMGRELLRRYTMGLQSCYTF